MQNFINKVIPVKVHKEYAFSSYDGRNPDGAKMMEEHLLFSSIDQTNKLTKRMEDQIDGG